MADNLVEELRAAAQTTLDHGVTADEMEKRAADLEKNGFSASADHTRCIASIMRSLEGK